MDEILPISLIINITPNTSGCYGLKVDAEPHGITQEKLENS